MAFQRELVLGVPVDLVSESDVLAFVRERVSSKAPAQVVTVNAEFVMRAAADEHFRRVISAAPLATPDGAGILWALKRQGHRLPRRVGGSDLVWTISEQAARLGHRLFLLGGEHAVAARAAGTLLARYPGLAVAGAHAGSPDPAYDAQLTSMIRESGADILFVAFGAPQQEAWIDRNLVLTGASIAIGVGGSLDYLAGTARRAPVWVQEHGLEWLWRLVRQPRRWRRVLALPRFAWRVFRSSHTSAPSS